MTDDRDETNAGPTPPPAPPPTETPPMEATAPAPKRTTEVTPEERTRILELQAQGRRGTRSIALLTGLGRNVVRRILSEAGLATSPARRSGASADRASKLDPYREAIKDGVERGWTSTRIRRELAAHGYTGGRSILTDYVRSIRPAGAPTKQVWRRFETAPAEELQLDWSTYSVSIGGVLRRVEVFSATLAWSRKTHAYAYENQRQSVLLEAHERAFGDFQGVTARVVLDNMSTAVLGRVERDGRLEPLWHPRYSEFAAHYAFKPFACKVNDPDRKGKEERFFDYLERDFVRGGAWDSLEAMNVALRRWLDEVCNKRVHGTTRRVPDEAWAEERPLLTALPHARYGACDEELRKVGPDSVLSIRGTSYTVPAALAHQTVTVRLYSDRFEVLGQAGAMAFTRAYVPQAEKGRLVIDPTHYATVPRHGAKRSTGVTRRLEDRLVARFPSLVDLVAGLKVRMKGLVHVHLAALVRLADHHGDEPFLRAATRVQEHRRYDWHAVRRLLEREAPPPEEPIPPVGAAARALVALGDVDPGTFDDYAGLDRRASEPSDAPPADASRPQQQPPTQEDSHGCQ